MNCHSCSRQRGFTLVELSVVLLVIALILGTSLSLAASRAEVERISQTNVKMGTILDNLQRYVMAGGTTVANGLPCPADPSIAINVAGYGIALADCTTANLKITTAGPVYYPPAPVVAPDMRMGAVPNRTMLLPDEYQLDGWGNKFAYVMNNAYGTSATLANLNTSFPELTVETTKAGTCTVPGSNPQACLTNDAAVILISYGKNARGAWTRKGTQITTGSLDADEEQNYKCAGSITTPNCSADNIFVAKSSVSTYDDITRYMVRWQLVPMVGSRIINADPACNRPMPGAASLALDDVSNYYKYTCSTAPQHCVPTAYVNGVAGLFDTNGVVAPGEFTGYQTRLTGTFMGGVAPNYLCMAPDGNQVVCAASMGAPSVIAGNANNSTFDPNTANCYWLQY